MAVKKEYPFLYFGHGTSYADKSLRCSVVFFTQVPSKNRKKIEKLIPLPLTEFIQWESNLLTFGSNDAYDGEVFEFMKKRGITGKFEVWTEFENILEEIFITLDKTFPILMVYKPAVTGHGFIYSKWHNWSVKQLFIILLPFYEKSELSVNSALLISGFINEYVKFQYPLNKKQIQLIINFLSQSVYLQLSDSPASAFYTLRTLNKVLSLADEDNVKDIIHNLPVKVQVKLLLSNSCNDLLRGSSGIDVNRVKELINISEESDGEYISDLLAELLTLKPLTGKNKIRLRSEFLSIVSDFITEKNITEALAVNLLFQCYELMNNRTREITELTTKIRNIVNKRDDLRESKYVKDAVSAVGSN